MRHYPNQQFRPRAPQQAKHLNDQVLADQRLLKARQEAAKKLRGVIDDGRKKLKKLLEELEHLKHERHEDEHRGEAGEKLDHVLHDLHESAHKLHAEIGHNPASHHHEYHQGVGGPEVGIFQLLHLFAITVHRIRMLGSRRRAELAKKILGAAKCLLDDLTTVAKRR